jgi:hypothetical protein
MHRNDIAWGHCVRGVMKSDPIWNTAASKIEISHEHLPLIAINLGHIRPLKWWKIIHESAAHTEGIVTHYLLSCK